jgi:pentapeptide MXKDX repeat protein
MKKTIAFLAAGCMALLAGSVLAQGMGQGMSNDSMHQEKPAKHKAKAGKKMDKMKHDGMAKDKMGKDDAMAKDKMGK